MFTRLERNAYAVLVVLALCAAIVLASPAPAQAQGASTDNTRDAHANARANLSHVMVRPGDSLWSISGRRLGPNATPQRIANGVERLYTLNRDRIGADPDLILVGQELLVPPMHSERHARATTARNAAERAEAGTRDRTQEGAGRKSAAHRALRVTLGGVAGGTPAEASAEGGQATRTAALMTLPNAVATVPDGRTLISNDSPPPVASFLSKVRTEVESSAIAVAGALSEIFAEVHADERRMLGSGVLLFTIVVAALMVRKLPMRFTTRRDFERWGVPMGHYGELSMYRAVPFAYHPGSLGDRGTQQVPPSVPTRRPRASADSHIRRTKAGEVPMGDTSAAARRVRHAAAATGRVRIPKAKSVPRNGLALGAHDSEVRNVARRANATMRARKRHPRRRASGQPRPPVAVEQRRGGEGS